MSQLSLFSVHLASHAARVQKQDGKLKERDTLTTEAASESVPSTSTAASDSTNQTDKTGPPKPV